MSTLTPYLAVADARAAIDWYADALGAEVTYGPLVMPDGRVGHAELSFDGAHVMLSDAHPEIGVVAPSAEGASVTMHLEVADVDDVVARAVARGAALDRGPEDNLDIERRVAVVRDPFGHRWFLLSPLRTELPKAAASAQDRTVPAATSPVWEGDDRPPIPRRAGEKQTLVAYLEHYRRTLELKTEGLTADQLSALAVPPSTMSLHGLVRHLAGVERWWFQQNFRGADVPMLYYTDEQPDLDFEVGADDPAEALAAWRRECDVSRRIVAEGDLDDVGTPVVPGGGEFSLRWLLLRMIAEYAQHCGHADLLRERIDGRTGA